jgi:hypothetical protein
MALYNYRLQGARENRKILSKQYEEMFYSEYAEKEKLNGNKRCKMKQRRREGRAYSYVKNVCLSALPT